jgi:Ca-activated chloride channel family protein
MTDHDDDSLLDAQLGDVPLPVGLCDRLRAACPANRAWFDDEIDLELAALPVPHGLLARCRQVVQDEPLDVALNAVEVPDELIPALQSLARREHVVPARRRSSAWVRRLADLSLAASLAVLVGGGYLAALVALLGPLNSGREKTGTLVVEYLGPLGIRGEPRPSELALTIAASEPPAESNEEAEQFVSWKDPLETGMSSYSGPAGELLSTFTAGGLAPDRDMVLLRYGVLGSPVRQEDLVEFTAVGTDQPRGLEPPLVRGFDRRFSLRHGVHPVVSPAAHPLLRSSRVPLSTDTTSFELAKRRLAGGRWPAPADVRLEDFLAAVDYQFPTPSPGRLGLSVSGGPSIFGQPLANIPSAALLHVGVQAGAAPFRTQPATHLVVGLDGAAAMQGAGRFEAARRGIGWLASQLGLQDRLSLVVFRDNETVIVEGVERARSGELLLALERLEPRGDANLGLGVHAAISLALRNEFDERLVPRVALITPGGTIIPEKTFARLEEFTAAAADEGVGVTLLECGSLAGADSTLAALATAARGDLRAARTADELRFALAESLTGSSSLVAADASLRITFNPRVVAGYRLLGHEANVLSAAGPARLETDLRVGQSATALFEVWLLPGSEDEVALAEVEWRDPHSGEKQVERQSLRRLQMAGAFAESSAALQQAALAAETAEVLRESFFVQGKPRSLEHVLDGTKRASYDLSKQPEFRRFITFLKDLEKARGKRSE